MHNLTIVDPADVNGALSAVSQFQSHYRHLSTAPMEYERSCFQRFLVVAAFAEEVRLGHLWHMDTDALAGSAVRTVGPKLAALGVDAVTAGVSEFRELGDSVSAGNAFLSLRALTAYRDFILENFYVNFGSQLEQWWGRRRENGLWGGVCDMTAWGLCLEQFKSLRIMESNGVLIEGTMLVNSWYRFESDWNTIFGRVGKALEVCWLEGELFARDSIHSVPLAVVHFSGADKAAIARITMGRSLRVGGVRHQSLRAAFRIQRRARNLLAGVHG